MSARPVRHGIEVSLRLLLIVAVVVALPANFMSDVHYYWLHAAGLSLHHLPYRDFLWEYPPVAALPLLLVVAAHGSYVCFLFMFAATMALLEYTCFLLVRRTWPEHAARIDTWWHVLGLPLATIAWFRLDFVAVLPATIFLVQLERGRRPVGALIAGVGAKLWPAVLVVALVARREWRQVRSAAAGCLAGGLAWYAFAPDGVRDFVRFRQGSGVQVESTFGAILRALGHHPVYVSGTWVVDAGHWTWVEPLGLGAVAAGALAVSLGVRRLAVREGRMVELLGACVLAVLLASRLFSPQFLVWALPFVVVAGARGRHRAAALFAGATALTVFEMLVYRHVIFGSPLWSLPVIARNGLLVGAVCSLVRASVERPRVEIAAADPVSAGQ